MSAPKKTEPVVGPLVASLVLLFPCALWWGFVGQLLWRWFVVPLGAPSVSLWHAYGLILVARYVTFKPSSDDDKKGWEAFGYALGYAVVLPTFVLGAAAVAHALS